MLGIKWLAHMATEKKTYFVRLNRSSNLFNLDSTSSPGAPDERGFEE